MFIIIIIIMPFNYLFDYDMQETVAIIIIIIDYYY